jgi:hypothetical protein
MTIVVKEAILLVLWMWALLVGAFLLGWMVRARLRH